MSRSGNGHHTSCITSAVANAKTDDLSPEDLVCDMCQTDPVQARALNNPLHQDWCPYFVPQAEEAPL